MKNLHKPSVLKSKDITLSTKAHIVKAMVFPVVMYSCGSWTIEKAEGSRIDGFELWYWRRLLRVPWTARRSNQSILKEINLNICWKDWCWSWSSNIWPPDVKSQLIGKDPDARRDWRQKERGWQRRDGCMAPLTQGTWVWTSSGRWWRTRKSETLQSMGLQRVRHDWETGQQQYINISSNLDKMRWQRNMFQTKEWDKTSEEAKWSGHRHSARDFQSNDCKDDQRAQETNEWTEQKVVNS